MPALDIRPRTLLDQAEEEGRVLIHGASWEFYEDVINEIGEDHYFVTYHEGDLEIMAPMLRHDLHKKLVARLVEAMALELSIDIFCAGSTTWRRKKKYAAIEA